MPQLKHFPLILVVIVIASAQFLPYEYGRFIFDNGIVHLIFALSGVFYGYRSFQSMKRKEKLAAVAMALSIGLIAFSLANFAGILPFDFMEAMFGYIIIIAGIFLL